MQNQSAVRHSTNKMYLPICKDENMRTLEETLVAKNDNHNTPKNNEHTHKTNIRHVRYYLGAEYPGIFLTQKELTCVRYLAQGNSIRKIARILNISDNGAEYFIVKARKKTNCQKARDLLTHPGISKLLANPNPVASPRTLKSQITK